MTSQPIACKFSDLIISLKIFNSEQIEFQRYQQKLKLFMHSHIQSCQALGRLISNSSMKQGTLNNIVIPVRISLLQQCKFREV